MPYFPFSCRINAGPEKTLKSLDMTLTGLELHNMQPDFVSLNWFRRGLSACPLAHNDTVEIFCNGRRLFRGRARLGRNTWQSGDIRILGPWSHLDEHVWNVGLLGLNGPLLGGTFTEHPEGDWYDPVSKTWKPWPSSITWTYGTQTIYTPPATTGTLDVDQYLTSRMWLFAPVSTGYKTVHVQLMDLLGNVLHVTDPDLIQIGLNELGGNASPKLRTIQDLPFSDAIRQTLCVKPDTAIWFDYNGTGVPVFNSRVASLEAATALFVGSRTGNVMPDYNVVVRDDLRPAGVVIRWEGDASESTGLGRPYLVDKWPSNCLSYGENVMVQTITEDIPRVTGIAKELYDSLSPRRTSGSLNILDHDFSLGLRPGRVFRINGDVQLTGVQNWVQSVRWNPDTGIASLSLGYPDHLGLRERMDLRGWLRRVFYVPGALVSQIMPPPP